MDVSRLSNLNTAWNELKQRIKSKIIPGELGSAKGLSDNKELIPWYEADLCDEAEAMKEQFGSDVFITCLACKQHVLCSSGPDQFKQHFLDEAHLVLHQVELYPLACFIHRELRTPWPKTANWICVSCGNIYKFKIDLETHCNKQHGGYDKCVLMKLKIMLEEVLKWMDFDTMAYVLPEVTIPLYTIGPEGQLSHLNVKPKPRFIINGSVFFLKDIDDGNEDEASPVKKFKRRNNVAAEEISLTNNSDDDNDDSRSSSCSRSGDEESSDEEEQEEREGNNQVESVNCSSNLDRKVIINKEELLQFSQNVTDEALKRRLCNIDEEVSEMLNEHPMFHFINIFEKKYQKFLSREKFDQLHKEMVRFILKGLKNKSINAEDISNEFIKFNDRGCFGSIACRTEKSLQFWLKYLNQYKERFTLNIVSGKISEKKRKLLVKFPQRQFPVKLSNQEFLDALQSLNSHIKWNTSVIASASNEDNLDLWYLLRMDEECYQGLCKMQLKVQFISGYLQFYECQSS